MDLAGIAAPIVMILISLIYFVTDHQPRYGQRALAAAHGVVGVGLLSVAALINVANQQRPYLAIPYLVLYLVPLALIVVAFVRYRGNRFIHLLQVPNLASLLWCAVIGLILIAGE